MYKSLFAGTISWILFAVSGIAQKPVVVADKEYDFVFITSYVIENEALDIHDYVDPFYNRDTLTGLRALDAAVANELGLKHIFWTDGHIHGSGLELHLQWIKDGNVNASTEFTHEEAVLKKARKSKGSSILIEMVDHTKHKAVWTGWVSLQKIKGENDVLRMQKGVRALIAQYPPVKGN